MRNPELLDPEQEEKGGRQEIEEERGDYDDEIEQAKTTEDIEKIVKKIGYKKGTADKNFTFRKDKLSQKYWELFNKEKEK